MYELYFKKLREAVPLTDDDVAQIASYLQTKKVRKKQYLLQEGDICKSIAFVTSGILRAYTVDEKGSEHIIQFAPEGWTIGDLFSFLTEEPAVYNIDALEDSEVVLIDRKSHDELLEKLPMYERYNRIQLTGAYIAMQRRLTSIISQPLEERYANLTAMYPQIVQRVPQHMIASYMGLTPETLSRVRRKITKGF